MVRTTVRVVAAPTPCAPPSTRQPEPAGQRADEQAEDPRLDQAGDEIPEHQRVKAVMGVHAWG